MKKKWKKKKKDQLGIPEAARNQKGRAEEREAVVR